MKLNQLIPFIVLASVILLSIGYLIGNSGSGGMDHSEHESTDGSEVSAEATTWTCSMHPQIKLPTKGKCPICFMDLIALSSSSGDDLSETELKMSVAAMALAEIETKALERKEASIETYMVGKIGVDTTLVSDVPVLSDGEIRKLYVNYSGVSVKKGEHLAEIYSPAIYAAGQDLLVTMGSSTLDKELMNSAVIKLKLLGVPQEYIKGIIDTKKVPETYVLRSPRSGYVEKLMGHQGMWIKKGMMLCRITDMTKLWVNLDAYESDLAWTRYGQYVKITAQAVPGKIFDGIIAYIPPRLDDRSRTAKVRVNVDNKKGELKPGMFVSAIVSSKVTARGSLTSPELRNKWISPMHPEIMKDGPGKCDICGMNLVKAEDLGYTFDETEENPLLIPETAVLITGKRAVVYVRKSGEKPIFEGRTILLGPKAGRFYVVLNGLKEGEQVVTKGNFKIDSALQIQAKPSMMSIPGGESIQTNSTVEKEIFIDNKNLRDSLNDMLEYYMEIRKKLSEDSFKGVKELALDLKGELEYVDYSGLKPKELKLWKHIQKSLEKSLEHIEHSENIEAFREAYKKVSDALVLLSRKIGHPLNKLNVMFCSMANAKWLQTEDEVSNPYYGASMLKCGDKQSNLPNIPTK
jgi:Cu(I)/Ag(I) efflux system membrane fusion protein